MPDLNAQIEEWRRTMLAAGIPSPTDLDELEAHLRDDVEWQMREGVGAEKAFEAAVQRLGSASALGAEFAKVRWAMSALERRITWILGGIIVAMDVAVGLVFLFDAHPLIAAIPWRERVLAAAACFAFPAIMWSWRYFCRFLPVVTSTRNRLALWVASGVLGGICTAILGQCIPADVDPFDGQYLGMQVWAFLPWVIGVTLIFGLEEAAYRKVAAATR